jgi:hypothetical protein
MDDHAEQQEMEVEALQSIYLDDLQGDLPSSPKAIYASFTHYHIVL